MPPILMGPVAVDDGAGNQPGAGQQPGRGPPERP